MKPITIFQKTVAVNLCVLACVGWIFLDHSLANVRPGLDTVQGIRVKDLGDRIQVNVETQGTVRYQVVSHTSPTRTIVTLPGFTHGSAVRSLSINKPPLLEVIPQKAVGRNHGVRVVFRLASNVEPRIRKSETGLIVEFPKSMAQMSLDREHAFRRSAGDAIKRTVARSSQSLTEVGNGVSSTAVMTNIEVLPRKSEAVIRVGGVGISKYKAHLLNKTRLIVDLPGASSTFKKQNLVVGHRILKQIRIGKHPSKVRLVFDLARPVSYKLQYHGHELTIVLKEVQGRQQVGARKSYPISRVAMKQEFRHKKVAKAYNVSSRPQSSKLQVSLYKPRPKLAQMGSIVAEGPRRDENPALQSYKGRRISLDFQKADISNVLRLIAEVSGLNVVVGEKVKAKVTMKLDNIPWDQALEMLLKTNNLGMVQEGNIVWIDTLKNISTQQDAEAKALESRAKAEPLISKIIYVKNVSADSLLTTLKPQLSPRGRVQVNTITNSLVLEDAESKVANFIRLVRQLDLVVPQVQIEARIVQADTSFARSLGVQWGFVSVRASTATDSFTSVGNLSGGFAEPIDVSNTTGGTTNDFIVNLPAAVTGLSSIPGFGFVTGTFTGGRALDMRISAGELLGLTKVIAAPKILTLDKQEAKIEQGESIPFQTTSLQGTQTTFVDANLTLQVTPQITSRDPNEKAKNILLKVKATRNAVGARSNPAGPSIDKREANTQVMVRDGETMVIGGIFVDNQSNNVGGVPYLSRIPVLGWLFKNKTEAVSKQELLIFLTPTIAS